MLKKFRKVTVLALALAMIFAMSANVFAVDAWSHTWTASDEVTRVQYDCRVYSTGTYGSIDSESNQGEVYVEVDYWYNDSDNMSQRVHRYDNGIYYAGVSEACPSGAEMEMATYSFYAYVDTTGEEFESGAITLTCE